MSDLIRREDAIDAVRKIVPVETEIDSTLLDKAEVIVELSVLPSAEASQNLAEPNKELKGSDLISRQAAIDAMGEEPPVWYDGDDEIAERNQWRRDKAAIESLPSAEPKTMDKTNANKIYNYLKEQIGDTVDDMKEFDAWFKRMVWHVKECNRLTAEPKTGEWEFDPNGMDWNIPAGRG